MWCARNDTRGDYEGQRLSTFDHAKNAIDIIFNNKDSVRKFIWSPWSEQIIKEALQSGDKEIAAAREAGRFNKKKDKMFLGVAGCSSCVSGDTVLDDPVNGEGLTIKEYCDQGIRPWVQTLNGPVLADVPYLKGKEALFKVKLSHGGSFTCTANHRVLTFSGWKFLKNVSPGESLVGYEPSPQGSSLESSPSTQKLNAPRYSQKAEDLRCPSMVAHVQVESIDKIPGDQFFYDLNVPKEHHYFSGGAVHHNSGKSDAFGMLAVFLYLSDPVQTLVLATSTTIEMAKLRIYKSVKEYWTQVEHYFKQQGSTVPGKAVHSKCVIRGVDATGELTDASGIRLVAADKQKGEEATSKVMGAKASGEGGLGLCVLIADELPDLAANLLTVAYTNLINNPKFYMYGIGNPNLKLDPFGKFCEPEAGWESVKHEPDEWKTRRGKVIRFDARKNPNLDREDNKYFWMPTQESIDAAARDFGPKSRKYYRMFVGMWCSDKAPNAIYSESELLGGSGPEPEWDNSTNLIHGAGLDISFTSGGDRSASVEFKCGTVKGVKHFHVDQVVILDVDAENINPTYEILHQWKDRCVLKGINPKHAGLDASGAGVPAGQYVNMNWSPYCRKVDFGGKPSGREYVLSRDAKQDYYNLASELWIQPKLFLRSGQISGLTTDIIEELVAREYHTQEGAKLRIEAKKDIKGRTGRSPDLADAFVIALYVAVLNGLLDNLEEKSILKEEGRKFKKLAKGRKKGIKTFRKTKRLKY